MSEKLSEQLNFKSGLKDGLPIGLGYLSVSFAFGVQASILGIPVFKVICTPTPCPKDVDAYHHQLKNAQDIFFKIFGLTILKVEKKDFYV